MGKIISKGQEIWLVKGLKFTDRDGQIYALGNSAFESEAEANEAAIEMQGRRLEMLYKKQAEHLRNWLDLIEGRVDYGPLD